MYRIKLMNDQEWVKFQSKFVSICKIVLKSHGLGAVFVEPKKVGKPRAILVPDCISKYMEALMPGGWEDCINVQGERWILLAGTSTAFSDFGLREWHDRPTTKSEHSDRINYTENMQYMGALPREEFRVN